MGEPGRRRGRRGWFRLRYRRPRLPAGWRGSAQLPGFFGVAGALGAVGALGVLGAAGALGRDGALGADGVVGADGADGADGALGADGAEGALGRGVFTDGAAGALGGVGADGIDGAEGADGVDSDGTPRCTGSWSPPPNPKSGTVRDAELLDAPPRPWDGVPAEDVGSVVPVV